MNSKEALNKMSDYIGRLGGGETLEEEIILKDLEVLGILKKYINIVNNGFTLCGNYYDEKDFKKEDFRKIKEWLENDYR